MGTTKKKKARRRKVAASAAETAATLTAESKRKKADPKKFDRAARYTLVRTQRRSFDWQRGFSSVDAVKIVRLRKEGEQITGILGESQPELWGEATYPLLLDDGTLVRLPANFLLRKVIKLADCIHQRVTITYLGKDFSSPIGGHYKKVFRVDPAPLGKDGVGPKGAEILSQAMRDALADRDAKRSAPKTT